MYQNVCADLIHGFAEFAIAWKRKHPIPVICHERSCERSRQDVTITHLCSTVGTSFLKVGNDPFVFSFMSLASNYLETRKEKERRSLKVNCHSLFFFLLISKSFSLGSQLLFERCLVK